MSVTELYGFENSLSNSNTSLNNTSAMNGSYLNGSTGSGGVNMAATMANGGCAANTIGGTPQMNGNSPSIPYSPLTPSSLSSGSFATPAKNFDALQVSNIHSYLYTIYMFILIVAIIIIINFSLAMHFCISNVICQRDLYIYHVNCWRVD